MSLHSERLRINLQPFGMSPVEEGKQHVRKIWDIVQKWSYFGPKKYKNKPQAESVMMYSTKPMRQKSNTIVDECFSEPELGQRGLVAVVHLQ